MSRLLTAGAVAIVAAGLAECAPYPTVTRDGTLTMDLANAAGRAGRRVHESFDDVMSGSGGTYMDRLLADRDSTVERWPDHLARPLLVWIDSSGTIAGPQAGFPAAVRAAFAQWASTGIPLRFAYIDSPRHADIRVHWANYLEHKTGSTSWRTDHTGWLESSDITLATHMSSGEALDARGMRAIALHEVGHALGMSHSADARDIMAPLVRVDGLSTTDRATIKYLYTLQAEHLN